MKISVIIPTFNEERYLPKLLKSLSNQDFLDFEVIVSDAQSIDNTKNIAKRFNCTIVNGGLPAVGRNNGAKIAKGEILLFLDSDVILPKNFITKAYAEMIVRDLDAATVDLKPISENIDHKIYFEFTNILSRITSYTNQPQAFGTCIICKRKVFEKIKGFDKSIIFAEDAEFLKRLAKHYKFRVLNSTKIKVSPRRIIKEGGLQYMFKGLFYLLYRLTIGDVRKEILKYEFGNYSNEKKRNIFIQLTLMRKKLILLNGKPFNIKKFKSSLTKLISIFIN